MVVAAIRVKRVQQVLLVKDLPADNRARMAAHIAAQVVAAQVQSE